MKYNNVFYTYCDDIGENEGGYFIQFYADPDLNVEIDYMVLHTGTDEVKHPEKYIHEYIDNEKLNIEAGKEALKYGILNNPMLLEIVNNFMSVGDKEALEELYSITEDDIVKLLMNWKNEDKQVGTDNSVYEELMSYIWKKYRLNEITDILKTEEMESSNER